MSRPRPRRTALGVALAVAGLTVAAACARMGAPPGGPEDRIPPQVVATTPDTFAVLDGPYREAVVFRFNERISERPTGGDLSDAVVVSPRTGQVEVEHNRESLEVSIIGGFREGVVYRVTLHPEIRDMFDNPMPDAFELVFSTGPEIEPYVLAGTVTDRITGQRIQGARVDAVLRDARPDTLVHTAVTDTGGVFAMRYIPPGAYRVTAFEDRNRNAEIDAFESRGTGSATLDPPADTAIVEVATLAPDTTAARIASAEVVDSTAVLIETDDHLDSRSRYLDAVRVQLAPGEENAEEDVAVPGADSLLHTHEWERRLAAIDSLERARADSAARERSDSLTAVADSLLARSDSAAADSVRTLARRADPGPPPGGADQAERPPRTPAAEQTFYVLFDAPLEMNVPYRITVEGIENINEVSGGGGEASIIRTPPPDTTMADTVSSEADTTAVPDTASAAPDTTGRSPTGVPPPPGTEPHDAGLFSRLRSTEVPGG